MHIFLGGTVDSNIKWRDEIIPLLEKNNIQYFNPVVDKWDANAIMLENLEKSSTDKLLYLITEDHKGIYTFLEIIETYKNNKEKLIVAIYNRKVLDNPKLKPCFDLLKQICDDLEILYGIETVIEYLDECQNNYIYLNKELIGIYDNIYNYSNKEISFLTEPDKFIQFAIFNKQNGSNLNAHYHKIRDNNFEKVQTQEVLYVVNGKVLLILYNENNDIFKTIKMGRGDFYINYNSRLGYDILENHTKLLEFKTGPYLGEKEDRILL